MAVLPLQDTAGTARQIQRGFLPRLFRNRRFTTGLLLFLVMLVAALAVNFLIDPALHRTGSFAPRQPPGPGLLLGSDSLGRSIGIQLGQAIPNSIQIGLLAATIGTLLGALIGFTSGYFGGWIDAVLRILIDVFLS